VPDDDLSRNNLTMPVQVPLVAWPWPPPTQLIGIVLPKFATPLADRFMRDLNAAFQ
jgi:hypothetical protein